MVSYEKIKEFETELNRLMEIKSNDPENEINNKEIKWLNSNINEMKKELKR